MVISSDISEMSLALGSTAILWLFGFIIIPLITADTRSFKMYNCFYTNDYFIT